jgi:outer membrane protein assembly factor BamA
LTRDEWVFIPAVVYSPETNLGVGIRAMRVFTTDSSGVTRPSTIPLTFLRTLNKQTLLTVEFDRWGKGNQHQFYTRLEFQDFPFKYYGMGNAINPTPETYASKIFYGHLQYHKKISPSWFLGPRLEVGAEDVYQKEVNGSLERNGVLGSKGYFIAGVGADFILDTRDQIFQPTQGWYSKFSLITYESMNRNLFGFTRYTIDIRKYFEVKENHILAWQTFFDTVSGTVPFQRLPMMGGSDVMRGYFEGKYRGQRVFANQVEYRFPVYRNLGLVLFTGVGQVSQGRDIKLFQNQRVSGGLGFRYRLNKEGLNVRLDLGYGDQRAFYFGLREVI